MKLRTQVLVFGLAAALTTLGASPALAAKGVKKNQGKGAEHHHRGTVVAVDHKKGMLEIAEHHKGKKKNGKGANHLHKFTVNAGTKVFTELGNGPKHASNFAAVHKGEHVSVAAHEHHADAIVIHHHKKNGKNGKKRVNANNNLNAGMKSVINPGFKTAKKVTRRK
jgi:hypothetical protein